MFFERSNLDGSEAEAIPTLSVGTFTLNVKLRKLYWITGFADDVLYRSDLDGSGIESHTYPGCCIFTVEAIGDDVFFGAGGLLLKGIWRGDSDGSNEQFLHPTPQPFDLAHDPVENKLYVTTIEGTYRLNPDGTGFEEIFPEPVGLPVVDPSRRKIYWLGGTGIRRSNLDGSNVEDFVTPADAGNPNLAILGLTFVDSTPVTGACCSHDPFAPCVADALQSECDCPGCLWHPFQSCAELDCPPTPIPTTSAWGLTTLTLTLMIGAKIVFGPSNAPA